MPAKNANSEEGAWGRSGGGGAGGGAAQAASKTETIKPAACDRTVLRKVSLASDMNLRDPFSLPVTAVRRFAPSRSKQRSGDCVDQARQRREPSWFVLRVAAAWR